MADKSHPQFGAEFRAGPPPACPPHAPDFADSRRAAHHASQEPGQPVGRGSVPSPLTRCELVFSLTCPDQLWDPRRYLFRDNDRLCGWGVPAFLERCAIEEVRMAYRSPRQSPYIERFVSTLRRESLPHVVTVSPEHVERRLRAFIDDYYRVARPHQGLDGRTPIPRQRGPTTGASTELMSVRSLGSTIATRGSQRDWIPPGCGLFGGQPTG